MLAVPGAIGRAGGGAKAAAAPALTSEEARQQAKAEGLMLLVAENKTGYFDVNHYPGRSKPYKAQVQRGGKTVGLGYFATAEEAALCIARSPEGQEAAGELPWSREDGLNQAQKAGLTLRTSRNKSGYFGVTYLRRQDNGHVSARPYQARLGKVYLGVFATAEEAAFLIAAETALGCLERDSLELLPSGVPVSALATADAEAVILAEEGEEGGGGGCTPTPLPPPPPGCLKRGAAVASKLPTAEARAEAKAGEKLLKAQAAAAAKAEKGAVLLAAKEAKEAERKREREG